MSEQHPTRRPLGDISTDLVRVMAVMAEEMTQDQRVAAATRILGFIDNEEDSARREFLIGIAASLEAGYVRAASPQGTGPITVVVHAGEGRHSYFNCPKCERRISFTNAFPLSFQWKRCPGCRLVWANLRDDGIGPRAEDMPAGTTNELQVASTGRPS